MARKRFEVAFELAGKVNGSLAGAFKSAEGHMSGLNRTARDLNRTMSELERAYKKGQINTKQYANSQKILQKELKRTESAQRRMGRAIELDNKVRNLRDRSRGALFDNVARGAMLAAPLKSAIAFEDAMSDVRKVVDFDTPKQFEQMGQDILQMTKDIPMAKEELAALVAAGGQSGIKREELLDFGQDAAKMGVAFDISGGDAGQLMAEWRAAFQMTQPEVIDLADKVNHLGNITAASAPRISEVVQRIGPLGEVGGLVSGEIAALGATMIGMGVSEEIAATGIKNMILSLTKGEQATKSQKDALKKLGFGAKEMAQMMQDDAEGAIIKILESIQSLDEVEQTGILNALFGSESIGAIAPLLTNLDELKKNFHAVGDEAEYAGSMQKEYDAKLETTSAQLQLFKNNLGIVGEQIGGILLPALNQGLEAVKPWIDKIQEWIKENPKLAKGLTLGVAGAMALSVAISGLGLAVSLLFSPFTKLIKLIAKLRSLPAILRGGASAANLLGRSLSGASVPLKGASCPIPQPSCPVGGKGKGGKGKGGKGGKGGKSGKGGKGKGGGRTPSKSPKTPKFKLPKLSLGGFAKGAGKLGARLLPGVGTALLAVDALSLAKKGWDKAGGMSGIKKAFSSFGKGKEGRVISDAVQKDTTRASTHATAGGRNVSAQFGVGMAGMGPLPLSPLVRDEFGNIISYAGPAGLATGVGFSTALTGVGLHGFSTGMQNEMGLLPPYASGIGMQTGNQFLAGMQGVGTNGLATGLMNDLDGLPLHAGTIGRDVGTQLSDGISSGVDTSGLETKLTTGLNDMPMRIGFEFTNSFQQAIDSSTFNFGLDNKLSEVPATAMTYGQLTGTNFTSGMTETASASELSGAVTEQLSSVPDTAGAVGQEVGASLTEGMSASLSTESVGATIEQQLSDVPLMAGMYGQEAGAQFSASLQSTMNLGNLSEQIHVQLGTIPNVAGMYGTSAGSQFSTGLQSNINISALSASLNQQLAGVATLAGTHGQSTGRSFSVSMAQSINISPIVMKLTSQLMSVVPTAQTLGSVTGRGYSMGIVTQPIPVGPWIASQLLAPLAVAASKAYAQGARISNNIARGLASGKAAISAQVSQIAALAARASSINVSVSGSAGNVPKYADGGIINRAHIGMVGEAGPEAIIPLNNKKRSHGLLQTAAQKMGYDVGPSRLDVGALKTSTASSSGPVTFNYSPTIVVEGDADTQEIKRLLDNDRMSFEREMAKYMRDKERVSFV